MADGNKKPLSQHSESTGTPSVPSEILIVDDNPQNAELLEAYLEPLEANVRIAVDGVDGLEKVKEKLPDIILLDVMMPRMSGYEMCRRLKNNPETKRVPVVMVTALNELGDIERGVDSGADDFLSKPINKLELLTRVKSLLRIKDLQDELSRTLSYMEDVEREERQKE